ncbi:MAG: hypothetical protein KIS73_10900, partial [Enhydrobacter sp.]|nr:hypothetical protein [Enhydrobacter sp.]
RLRRMREEEEQREAAERSAALPGGSNLGIWGQLRVAFERLDTESKKTGAAFGIDSGARRLEKVLELQRRRDAGEALNVTEKQYLLRNRNVASDLAAAVVRLQDAQRRLDELPASDPLRQLFKAQSVAEAARLLHQHRLPSPGCPSHPNRLPTARIRCFPEVGCRSTRTRWRALRGSPV